MIAIVSSKGADKNNRLNFLHIQILHPKKFLEGNVNLFFHGFMYTGVMTFETKIIH